MRLPGDPSVGRSRKWALALVLVCIGPSALAAPPPGAAVATAHPLATDAGRRILEAGGNAFDAAIAVAATLAVVEPFSSGLGGGGFFLIERARDRRPIVIDARERAPLAAQPDMYLDADGKPVSGATLSGPLAAAIPGLPAALVHLARRYGRLTLKRTLAPAIEAARIGFIVSPHYRAMAERRLTALLASPAAADVFLERGFIPDAGFVIRQPDLARTLTRLARNGHAGFYAGAGARALVAGVHAAGGIWSLDDLTRYRIIERPALQLRYRGTRVTTVPPPGGGIVLMQMLKILEHFDLEGASAAQRTHLVVEAMRRAYRDRAHYLGDPAYTADTARLLDPHYIATLAADIDRDRATPSGELANGAIGGGTDTTHFSILDRHGNRVAATLSINTGFGSGFVPPGTGVLLNNEMDDFASAPGAPNAYGLVGSSANAIAPGKRPLSSMSPTFLETDDLVVLLGTPGGSRIPTMVLLATLEVAAGRGGAPEWVGLSRFHHQYLPDRIEYEDQALDIETRRALERNGHVLAPTSAYGNMQLVVRYKGESRVEAATDPRGEGTAWVERRVNRRRAPRLRRAAHTLRARRMRHPRILLPISGAHCHH